MTRPRQRDVIDALQFDGVQTTAVRREMQNELARANQRMIENEKNDANGRRAQADKTARLRGLRLLRQAQTRNNAAEPKRSLTSD